jgi:ubiquitin-small subunit ribosomal protein S27Ae
MASKKKGGPKGKKTVKNKQPSEKWKKYKVTDGKITKGKTCPKCGPDTFLAEHKDRINCGKCGYTEFFTK